jgi:hypothetical protein
MGASAFGTNPCRRSIFDVFAVEKTETDMRVIFEAIRAARGNRGYGRIIARDGSEINLTEAELNAMESVLLDPVKRLKAEQFVYQSHYFSKDAELSECAQSLVTTEDPMQDILSKIQAASLSVVTRLVPPLEPAQLANDLAWPEAPGAFRLELEPLGQSILRDCQEDE